MARRLLDFYKFRSKFAALGWEMKKQSRLSRNARRRSPPLDFESLPGEQNMGLLEDLIAGVFGQP